MTNLTLIIQLTTSKPIKMEMTPETLPPDSRASYVVYRDELEKYVTKITRTTKNLTPRGVSDLLAKAVTFIEGVLPKHIARMSSRTSDDEMEIFIGVSDE